MKLLVTILVFLSALNVFGETYRSVAQAYGEQGEVVEASCMTFEQGMDAGCEYFNSEAAQRFCSLNFGDRYIPFIPNGSNCSLEKAAQLRGEVRGEKLVQGLASEMDEIEAIITMIDRQGLNPLEDFGFKKPEIGNEFYTDTVKMLMAKMNGFKNRLNKNGKLNVSIHDEHTVTYLKYALRYLGVLSRLHKVYAYVAHENHIVLKTYTWKNLDYLNLSLKKEHGLEVMSQLNAAGNMVTDFKTKTVKNGKEIEFSIGEQGKQNFEFMAMEDPYSKTDYAKLVTYMGVRENLTNLWAVQRMTPEEVLNESETRSCGNFLSFRPSQRPSQKSESSMKSSIAYQDLLENDIFINDYLPRLENLIKSSWDVSLLSSKSAKELGVHVIHNVGKVRELLGQIYPPLTTDKQYRERAQEDAAMLLQAENVSWMEFSSYHFSTIILPGDNVLNSEAILERIAQEAYEKRLKAITEQFVAVYVWISDQGIKNVENEVKRFAEKNLKAEFKSRLKIQLQREMEEYGSREALASQNRENKEEQTLEQAKKAMVAVSVLDAVKSGVLNFQSMKTLEPSSVEELMMLFQERVEKEFFDLQQTLEHNEEFAKMISAFFKEIAQEYKDRFVDNSQGYARLTGTEEGRAAGLREISYAVARKWFARYPYEILGHALREYPYLNAGADTASIPVYAGNNPAALSNKDFLSHFSVNTDKEGNAFENYVEYKSNGSELFGATEALNKGKDPKRSRNNVDKITSGELGRPVEVVSPGKIKTTSGEVSIDGGKLTSLLKTFGVLKASNAGKELGSAGKSLAKSKTSLGRVLVINSPEKFLFRVLEALNLEHVGMSAKASGKFANDEASQKFLASAIISQAYQNAPILRNEVTWEKDVMKYCFTKTGTPFRCDTKKTVSLPVLERIGSVAYDRETGSFNENKAMELISLVIDNAIANTPNKLAKFCDANYINYTKDKNFKDAFKASGFLRTSLKSAAGQNQAKVKRLSRYDQEIKKEIRTKLEAWNEDYFEPLLEVFTYAALAALAVTLILGSGGTAAPGVIGAIYGLATTLMTVEFFISFPLVVGSLYSRVNTHFIEVPAQLQFQHSLASSQIDTAKVVDWDMLNQAKEENQSSKNWTAGLAPLDFLYGGMLVRHVQKESGMLGRAAYARLTGAKLRGWSAPPKTMMNNPRFSEIRKQVGASKALKSVAAHQVNRVKSFFPKYQSLPEGMLHTSALRLGLARKADSLKIGNKPWAILEDIGEHTAKLGSRLKSYSAYDELEKKLVREVRMTGALKPGEALRNFKKTAVYFVPATLFRRIGNRDAKGVLRFFTRFGDVWKQLKKAQGEVLTQKTERIEAVAAKLKEFQKGAKSAHYQADEQNLMAQFLETLTDNEIMVLEEVAKKSNGIFGNFKKVFKDYNLVLHTLKPTSYLSAYSGQEFGKPVYSSTYVLDGQIDAKYAIQSDAQDLINFYESMMKQNGEKTKAMDELREEVEESLSRAIKNENGSFKEL